MRSGASAVRRSERLPDLQPRELPRKRSPRVSLGVTPNSCRYAVANDAWLANPHACATCAIDRLSQAELCRRGPGEPQPFGADQFAGCGARGLQHILQVSRRPPQGPGDAGNGEVGVSSVAADVLPYLRLDLLALRGRRRVGTGKSHSLIALGVAAIQAGHKVRYFTAAELVETLYRGLADNSVGRMIENLLRAELIIIDEVGFAPLDDTGAQLLFRLVAAAYERRALGIGSHWPFDQ